MGDRVLRSVLVLGWLLMGESTLCWSAPIRIGGMGGAMTTMEKLAAAYGAHHAEVEFQFIKPPLGSSGAIKALAVGRLDLALSARFLKQEEEMGLPAHQQKLGRTPLLLAVHRSLPVAGFTTAQLVEAYAGRVNTWPDGSRLRVVLRPLSDTDTMLLQSFQPMAEAVKEAHGRPGAAIAMTDLDSAGMVEKVPGALGTVTLGHLISEGLPLKGLAVDGVEPTLAAVAQGTYPFVKTLILIHRQDAPAEVRAFTDFLLSPDGRALLTEHGYAATLP